eukprot:7213020-Prymnesium_polylepis.1
MGEKRRRANTSSNSGSGEEALQGGRTSRGSWHARVRTLGCTQWKQRVLCGRRGRAEETRRRK